MKARRESVCGFCGEAIKRGDNIVKAHWEGFAWVHQRCRVEYYRRQSVNDGETFAGHKPSDWRRG